MSLCRTSTLVSYACAAVHALRRWAGQCAAHKDTETQFNTALTVDGTASESGGGTNEGTGTLVANGDGGGGGAAATGAEAPKGAARAAREGVAVAAIFRE